jgi:hypothetical protein
MDVLPVVAAAVAVSALVTAIAPASSAVGPAPLRARFTGGVIPGSGAEAAP